MHVIFLFYLKWNTLKRWQKVMVKLVKLMILDRGAEENIKAITFFSKKLLFWILKQIILLFFKLSISHSSALPLCQLRLSGDNFLTTPTATSLLSAHDCCWRRTHGAIVIINVQHLKSTSWEGNSFSSSSFCNIHRAVTKHLWVHRGGGEPVYKKTQTKESSSEEIW